MFWLELIVVFGMLLVGAHVGGIFLGMSSGVSLAVLIFGLGCTPKKVIQKISLIFLPPYDIVTSVDICGAFVKWLRHRPLTAGSWVRIP